MAGHKVFLPVKGESLKKVLKAEPTIDRLRRTADLMLLVAVWEVTPLIPNVTTLSPFYKKGAWVCQNCNYWISTEALDKVAYLPVPLEQKEVAIQRLNRTACLFLVLALSMSRATALRLAASETPTPTCPSSLSKGASPVHQLQRQTAGDAMSLQAEQAHLSRTFL